MNSRRARGLSVVEVLVYSALVGMVGLLLARFLGYYNFISASFSTRNALNTTATQLFAQLASECRAANSRGVIVSADGSYFSLQKATGVDSLGRTLWDQRFELYWYDATEDTICRGGVTFSEVLVDELLHSPQAITDAERLSAKSVLMANGRYKILAKNVSSCRFSKPFTEELFVELKLSQASRGKRVETAVRQHSFLLLSDREI